MTTHHVRRTHNARSKHKTSVVSIANWRTALAPYEHPCYAATTYTRRLVSKRPAGNVACNCCGPNVTRPQYLIFNLDLLFIIFHTHDPGISGSGITSSRAACTVLYMPTQKTAQMLCWQVDEQHSWWRGLSNCQRSPLHTLDSGIAYLFIRRELLHCVNV